MQDLTLAEKFALCLKQAQEIVAAHRAEAPEGCDPQNAGVAIGAAVIGAGASIYGAQQQKKQQRSLSELNGLPMDQQLWYAQKQGEQQLDQNRAQADLAIEYAPKFAQAQNAATQQLLKWYAPVTQRERTGTTAQRVSDLADFQKVGADWQSALGGASPAYAALNAQIGRGQGTPLLSQLNAEAMDGSPISAELQRQALEELQLRGQLTAEQERDATQGARAAYTDRGMLYGNQAIGAEILNRDAYARAREAQRRQFASGVEGQRQAFGLNVQNANEASQGNWQNFLLNAGQAQLNPIMALFGQRTAVNPLNYLAGTAGSPGAMSFGQVSTTAPSVAQGVGSLQGLYNYAGDVNNTNFNAAAAQGINQANTYAALGSGLMNNAAQMYVANKKYGG